MLRTALKPRWVALLVLALAAATVMAGLGQWQLNRARENSRARQIEAATSRPAVPLTSLLRPRQSFTNAAADRPVTAEGRWDGAHQLLVAERYRDGVAGWWVLTPLVLADSSAVAVVRGWAVRPDDPAIDAAALPTGTVAISGVLRPSEPPVDHDPGAGSGLPPGQLDAVDLTQLVQRWPQRLITGYVILTAATPAASGAPLALVPATAPSDSAVAWQNLSYAAQWFVFAGFGLFMWWRLVRDDHQGTLLSGSAPAPARGGPRAGHTAATGTPDAGASAPSDLPSDRGVPS